MTRKQQLFFCEKCIYRKMDMKQGLICELTGEKADFIGVCPNYKLDEQLQKRKGEKASFSSGDSGNKRIKPNKKRADLAILFVWLVMFFDILALGSSFIQYRMLISFQNGEDVSMQMFESNDLREQIVSVFHSIVYIASGVIFLMWFWRAYYNYGIRKRADFSNSWAVWAWVVPIISLFRPYQIMKEMYVGTSRLLKEYAGTFSDAKTGLLGIWWAFWIVSLVLSNIANRLSLKAETIDDFINYSLLDMVSSLFAIPLAIITVNIIKSYAAKEEELSVLEKQSLLGSTQTEKLGHEE